MTHPPQHDEILKTLQMYIEGSRQGKSELMRPAFQPRCFVFGYAGDQLAIGTKFLSIGLTGTDRRRTLSLAWSAWTYWIPSPWCGWRLQTGPES